MTEREIDFSRWKCRLGIHDWTKWKDDPSKESTITTGGMKQPVLLQERACFKCNKKLRQYVLYGESK